MTGIAQVADVGSLHHANVCFLILRIHTSDPDPLVRQRCVSEIELGRCPISGGKLKIIAAIEAPAVIVRILTHLGLPARSLLRAPARRVGLFQAA